MAKANKQTKTTQKSKLIKINAFVKYYIMNYVFCVFHIYLCIYRIKAYMVFSMCQTYSCCLDILRVLVLGSVPTHGYQNPNAQVLT